MTSVLDRLPRGSRAGIVRLRSLGDCVLTTPAIRLLKQARPDLSIAVVVEPRFAAVFEGNPDIDALIPPSAHALRRFHPDVILNLHGGGTSARITALSGARFRVGFAHFRFQAFYNVRIPTAQQILGISRKVHTAEHVAAAMFHLGVPASEIPPSRLFAVKAETGRAPYAVIHPVASERAKTWPAERFLAIADHLQRSLDLEPVFIAGPGEDLSAFRRYTAHTNIPLAQTKRLLSGATLFLGNDSGPAHMAAAFQIPTVVLFGPSDPIVWAPWRTPSEVLVCETGIQNISQQRVLDAVQHLRVHA
jgi:heptosyltransferase-3